MASTLRRHGPILLALIAVLALLIAPHAGAAGVVTGTVSVEGSQQLLADVAISDGEQVVLSDEQGCYRLETQSNRALIRLSVPSGYRPVDDRWFDTVHVRGQARVDFVLVPEDQPAPWTFVHVTDVHITPANAEHVRRFASDVNTLTDPGAALVVSTGDLVHNTIRNSARSGEIREAFAMYNDAMSGLQPPLLNLIGNHDHAGYRAGMSVRHPLFDIGAYERRVGPAWYSYSCGGVRLIAINNTRVNIPLDGRYHSAVSERCLRWLRADLAVTEASTPIILLMHQPPAPIRNGDALMALLAGRTVLGIFHGHRHTVQEEQYHGIPTYESGSLANCVNGPTGYRLVTVGREGIVSAPYRPFAVAAE